MSASYRFYTFYFFTDKVEWKWKCTHLAATNIVQNAHFHSQFNVEIELVDSQPLKCYRILNNTKTKVIDSHVIESS